MQIVVLFGLPGAGKTFVGKILSKKFGYFLYDADADLPLEMEKVIREEGKVTEEMRDLFIKRVMARVRELKKKHSKIAVAQTFIKERHRQQFLDTFSDARFILITADVEIREARLLHRKKLPISAKYARVMLRNFDKPEIQFETLENNVDGEEAIKAQVRLLLSD